MKWYPYGHDFGNAEMEGVTVLNGRNCACSIPTAFAKVDINAMRNLGVKVDESSTLIIQFDGERWLMLSGNWHCSRRLMCTMAVAIFNAMRANTVCVASWRWLPR